MPEIPHALYILFAFALGPREWDSKAAAPFFDALLGPDKPRG